MLSQLIRISGICLIGLAATHVFFARQLHWKEELRRLSLLNRQIFLVHSFFIAMVLVGLGTLCVLQAEALLQPTPLSRLLLAAMAVFWFLRLLVQLFVYDPSLWRGDPVRTTIHILFTLFWCSLVAVYSAALLA